MRQWDPQNCSTTGTGLRAMPVPITMFLRRKEKYRNILKLFGGEGEVVSFSRIFAFREGFWKSKHREKRGMTACILLYISKPFGAILSGVRQISRCPKF